MTLTATASGSGTYESENNGTFATANQVTSGSAILGQCSSSSDDDYYKISVGSSGLLNVALDLATSNYSTYYLNVYNSSGTLLGTLNTSSDGNSNFNVSSAGTYYVSVDSYSTAQYGLTLTATASGSDGTDTVAPTLSSMTPGDEATGILIGANAVLTLSETGVAGSGNILIKSGNTTVQTISVTDTSQVTFNGSTVTINPSSDLGYGTTYSIVIASGVITDSAGNAYAGTSTYNFTTEAAPDTSTGSVTAVAPSSNAGTAYAISSLEKPTNGENAYIDALALNSQWANNDGSTGTIEITYCTVHGRDPYNFWRGNGDVWSDDFLAALSGAMSSWEAVTNIDFVETSNPTQADIWYWSLSDSIVDFGGWHDFPSGIYSPSSTVNYSALNNGGDSTELGSYMYSTFVHELGHGLGLAHPHDGGTTFPGVTSESSIGTNGLNQGIWTVMSYNEGWQQEPSSSYYYGDVIGPMAFDIATIQKKYGANTSYETGSNTYLLPTINASGTGWACIWDAGGTDTISNAGSAASCVINLNAASLTGTNAGGYVSWNSGIVGGFTIANGVVIENAIGGNASDTLTGNASANVLNGGAGNDKLTGGAGIDTASYASAASAVTVNLATLTAQATGGAGSDTLATIENLTGSAFNDTLTGDTSANVLDGGLGNDTLTGGAGIDTFTVGSGTDTIRDLGTGGADVLSVAAGAIANATVNTAWTATSASVNSGTANITTSGLAVNLSAVTSGNGFNVTNTGTAATLTGSSGADILMGGAGADTLVGGAGNDTLTGGSGIDRFTVGSGTDTVRDLGTGGADVLSVAAGAIANATVNTAWTATSASVNSGTANITTSGLAVNLSAVTSGNGFSVTNTGTAATLTGSSGADTLTGGTGADTLDGGLGNDTLTGGAGIDTASYASAASAVTVNLATLTAQATGGAGSDTLATIENLTGSAFNDTLTGDASANVLVGGLGNDMLTGGAGYDTFIFNTKLGTTNLDRITDFSVTDDTIWLENTGIFTALTTLGTLSSSSFHTGTAAGDAADRIIYNSTTGSLSYDVDGSGKKAAVQFATLTTGLELTNADFWVI